MKHVSSSVPSLEERHGPVSRCVSVARRQRRDSDPWHIDLQVSRRLSRRPVVPSLFRPTTVPTPSLKRCTDTSDSRHFGTVKTWSDEWLLRLNIDKCKTVSYYLKHPPLDTQYHIIDGNTTHILEKLNSINDLGVIFDSNLTFKDLWLKK